MESLNKSHSSPVNMDYQRSNQNQDTFYNSLSDIPDRHEGQHSSGVNHNEYSSSDVTYECQRSPETTVEYGTPVLRDGKEYHVMISYQREDKEWMRGILESLEAPPYNLACCVHDRDFDGGKEIITNIGDCLQLSQSVIIVLSPEYINSAFCDLETKMALQMKHENMMNIIPVLRRGEQIPTYLRHITYVDGRHGNNDEYVTRKIAAAICRGTTDPSGTYTIIDDVTNSHNGDEVILCPEMYGWGYFHDSYRFPPLSPRQLKDCKEIGIQVDQGCLDDICGYVTSCYFPVYYTWLATHWGRLGLLMWRLAIITACNVMLGYSLKCLDIYADLNYNLEYGSEYFRMFGLFVGVPLCVLVLIIVFVRQCVMFRKDHQKPVSSALSKITRKKHVVVKLGEVNNKPCIHLTYNNFSACEDYIKEHIWKPKVDDLKVRYKEFDSFIDRVYDITLGDFLYCTDQAPRTRHNNNKGVKCLCLFVESPHVMKALFGEGGCWVRWCMRAAMCCRRAVMCQDQNQENGDRQALVV